ncbi:MAG TPA: S41 family peptidase [Candidatus Acidoferrum sp.]|nr:S41 family peptidase [Candidatus Acidoferrum sp.]
MITRETFLALAASFVAVEHFVEQTPPPEPTFSPQVVQTDLDAIWSALIDVGTQPFRTSNQTNVTALYRTTRAGIHTPMTTRAAWLAIAPVLGALNDGHVSLGFPDPLNNAPRLFPLRFALSPDNQLIVIGDRTNTIEIGSTIDSIDNVTAASYRDTTLAAFGGQTALLHRTRVSMAGAWSATALFGTGPIFSVRWTSPDGTTHQSDLLATPPVRSAATSAFQPYTYRTLKNGSIGYIDYRSCEDLDRFKTFLIDTFTSIKLNPIRALIIDIRRNGGGDSDLNNALWSYVTTKPFKQFGGIIEKSCTRLKGEYGPDKYKAIYGDEAWDAPNGKIIEFGTDPNADLIHPGPLALRYSGPVYLLISAQTFSSAMSCALAARDYGLATIVGEETGEPVNSTGEIYTFTTPGIGLRAYLTTKVFLAPKPHPNDQGVVPDIPVTTTPSDIAAGRDPVLDKVFAMIG